MPNLMNYNEYAEIVNYLSQEPNDSARYSLKMLSVFLNKPEDEVSILFSQIKGLGCPITLGVDGAISLLDRIDPYSQNIIKSALSGNDAAHIEILLKTDSTNSYLKSTACSNESLSICLAELQLQGRGRRGKTWASPFGSNIYLSLKKRININPRKSGGVSLIVGLAIIKAVEGFGFSGLQIKWPNDILVGNKKLAGVLIEVAAVKRDSIELVIGVGLNVRMTVISANNVDQPNIDQPWVSLQQLCEEQGEIFAMPTRNEIVIAIVNQISLNLLLFERDGLCGFFNEWEKYDLLIGRQIRVKQENDTAFGVAQGLNEFGELRVQNESGITYINAGEVSVRLS